MAMKIARNDPSKRGRINRLVAIAIAGSLTFFASGCKNPADEGKREATQSGVLKILPLRFRTIR
jgi:hypothetical protein